MILYDGDDDNGPSPFNLHPCHPDDLIRFTFPYISALFFFFRRGMVLFDRHRLKSNRLVRLLMPDNLLGALRLAWVILVIWGEIGVFLYTLSDCRWPTPAHNTVRRRRCSLIGEPDRSKKSDKVGTRPTHILLVADAQVSMRTADSWTFSRLFDDVYMRRAWKITRRLRPHQVFFLGDMLKTGKSVVSDDE